MKKSLAIAVAILFAASAIFAANPKREFRGAWMHTVFQGQYARQNTEENKAYLRDQLDKLKAAGVNAVFFQVRPQADAFYASALEPWSCYLTKDGAAPKPFWDPLQFMVEETHKRGMELHAWLNPYRVTSSAKQTLPANHIYHKHPERFVTYGGKMYFDPALPENREFIYQVVMDIASRYDVDGIHFDDYFYPYPVKGEEFPDAKSYARYGNGMDRGDWRRHNVDLLIEGIHDRLAASKPWIRFGVSPFGIFRNKSTDPKGSETRGLQNYDDLYANVILWAQNGWVDYVLPQLYWEIGHKSADYLPLVQWWNDNAGSRHMYIGQDVDRTMKFSDAPYSADSTQLRHKITLTRQLPNIQGNCWWPGYSVTSNRGGVADSLRNEYQSNIALMPAYPWINDTKPQTPQVRAVDGKLQWNAQQQQNKATDVNHYAVYRFENQSDIDISNGDAVVDIVYGNTYSPKTSGYYVVTALSRTNSESAPSSVIKL